MSYAEKRIEYNNSWPNKVVEFPIQKAFIELLASKEIKNILIPIKLPNIDDTQFQRLLSFKIDIYDQLPYKPDIAFDIAWRTFEAYTLFHANSNGWNTKKNTCYH